MVLLFLTYDETNWKSGIPDFSERRLGHHKPGELLFIEIRNQKHQHGVDLKPA